MTFDIPLASKVFSKDILIMEGRWFFRMGLLIATVSGDRQRKSAADIPNSVQSEP